MANEILEAALAYADRGWPVFPCKPRGKTPLTLHGFKDASTDPEMIRVWWRRWPNANVAIATGPRSFDALDVDGADGERSLSEIEARHYELPTGPRQITGRGRQLFFRGGTLGVTAGRLPGLDTRGDGGYVVAAPSIHPDGPVYVMEDEDEPLPEPPEWLLRELRGDGLAREMPDFGPPIEIENETARLLLEMAGIRIVRIPQGHRDDTIFRFGASMRARGMDATTILRILRLANEYLCDPPLPDETVRQKATSASRYDIAPAYRVALEAVERMAERATAERVDREFVETATAAARGADTSEKIAAARKMLAIPLVRVTQSGRKPATYGLVVDVGGGEEVSLPIKNLLSHADVRRSVFDALGVVVPAKAKEWPAAAVLLRSIAEYEDPGLADPDEETGHYLERFLERHGAAVAETEEDFRALRLQGSPVIQYQGERFVRFEEFSQHCDRIGLRDGVSMLWARLKRSGAVIEIPASIRTQGGVARRRYWRVVAVTDVSAGNLRREAISEAGPKTL